MPKGVYKHKLHTEATKRKISTSKKESWSDPEYRKRHLTPEVRLKHSETMKRKWKDPDHREKHIASYNTPEVKLKHSLSAKFRWTDPGYKNNHISIRLKKSMHTKSLWKNLEFRNKIIAASNTPEVKLKKSIATKELWKDPKFIEKILKGNTKKPNRPESKIIDLNLSRIRYTGNGNFWRYTGKKYRNPDFKVTGQNKVIEVFGDYWHRNEDPQDIINEYRSIGLSCLVFWASEIDNNISKVRAKIIKFRDTQILEEVRI